MRKNDLTEIKQLEFKALVAKILTAKKELSDLVLDRNMNKLKDVKVISKRRKDIAKMQTIANQKRVLESLVTSNEEKAKSSKKKGDN